MIPARPLLGALAALLVLGVAAAFRAEAAWWWWAALGGVAAAALVDLVLALREPPVEASRRVEGSLALGARSPVHLRLTNRAARPLRLRVFDHFPAPFACAHFPVELRVGRGAWGQVDYEVVAEERGEHRFARAQVRAASPLGLWWRDLRCGEESVVRVYPDFAAVAKYILLAADERLSQIGVRKRRRRGTGSEFHQLREYHEGDALRQIDWRATARTRKLISREYQDERDQRVVFLLDCGRRMRTRDAALSHFDEALNAVLLLAYVALRQGDAVGLGTFGGGGRWLAPVKGRAMMSRFLNLLYDLQPSADVPDYSEAALALLAHQRKHALVVVVTSLRDEDTQDLLPALHILQRRHLVLLASLREQALDRVLDAEVADFDDAVRLAATHDYLEQRRDALQVLRANGVLCLDVPPARLSVELVNAYLAVKARGAL